MSASVIAPVAPQDLNVVFSEVAQPPIEAELRLAGPQSRLRVCTLPALVMADLCGRLQSNTSCVVRMLAEKPTAPWEATATKLIELRNSVPGPLLVFVPPGARTAAEDSLDIATFTELTLPVFGAEAVEHLLKKLAEPLRASVAEVLQRLREQKVLRHVDDELEYLATVLKNGGTPHAAGGALYVFGLIPDFEVFTRGALPAWLSRNQNAREALADVRQPLSSRINRLPIAASKLQSALFGFLRGRHCDDTRAWSREIATNGDHAHLSLDKWPFTDRGGDDGTLRLLLEPLPLQLQQEDTVSGTSQLPVFEASGRDGLKVTFRSVPPAPQAERWVTFRFQLIAFGDEQPTEAWDSNSYPKPKTSKRAVVSRTIKAEELRGLPEGTYVLRVNAYDKDGTLITTPQHIDAGDPKSRLENESEPFLIAQEKTEVVETETRAMPVPSLMDAWVAASTRPKTDDRFDLAKVHGAWSELPNASVRGDTHFRLEGEVLSAYAIVVPGLLRKFEFQVLKAPDQLGAYKVRLDNIRRQSDVNVEREPLPELPSSEEWKRFLATRKEAFDAILSQHLQRGGKGGVAEALQGIVETCDLPALREQIEKYAAAFVGVANSISTSDEAGLLARVDALELRWPRAVGDPGRGILLGPTHPVRMLWHLQHALFEVAAVGAFQEKSESVPSWSDFLLQVRRGLQPINLPLAVFDSSGRGYVENGPLTPFWSLYLPDRFQGDVPVDVSIARDAVRHLLGIRGQSPFTGLVSSEQVANRLFEYLVQHPYCEQLRINVFNPGDGEVIADALRLIERQRLSLSERRDAPSLRYSVQMFGTTGHLEIMGEAVESLLDPERQVGESDEEFTVSSTNHLLQKLIYAKNTIEEFLREPARFTAHVSVFLEHFAVQSRLASIAHLRRGSFVKGLVEETEMELATARSSQVYGWHRGLRPKASSQADAVEKLIVEGLGALQRTQAVAATKDLESTSAPIVALQLDARGQALLKHVHEVSDWVLLIDRNLGLDYFDSASSSRDSGYLLDFAPEFLQEDRQRLLLTTRSSLELQGIVKPTLESFGLEWKAGDEDVVLENLRSLSGRLALRLMSSAQAAEITGLLLARLALEEAGFLEERLLIPLDAHRGWFTPDDEKDGPAFIRSQQRADLLIVELKPKLRRIRMSLVEVKLREELDDARRIDLYAKMREQAENSRDVLRRQFDLNFYSTVRADRLLRAKELSTVLSFYARRSNRYRLLSKDALNEALTFIQDLDGGYELDFDMQGIAFEQRGVGEHHDEDEPGYSVHRFGLDVANDLLERARRRQLSRRSPTSEGSGGGPGTPPATPPSQGTLQVKQASFDTLREALGGARRSSGDPRHLETPPAAPPVEQPSSTAAVSVVEEVAAAGATAASEEPKDEFPKEPIAHPRVEDVRPEMRSTSVSEAAKPIADILLGASEFTPQYGVLGRSGAERIAVDLTGCNTISLFGVQGFGKSYTLGVIAEMATTVAPGINLLPAPLATVVFHYHKSDAYEPEYATSVAPNEKQREVQRLLSEYCAQPRGVSDLVLLSPADKVEARKKEFPELEVLPIKFASREVGADGWKFLLGAVGNDSLYLRQIVAIMRKHRSGLTIDTVKSELASLPDHAQRLALDRLALAEPYIDDDARLADVLRPGRTVVVDLRDEWIEKDEALGLFVVMMRIFASSKVKGREFNKLVVFDEAHKYITESDLIGQVVETIREMRHQATSIVIASQDPLSVPRAVIELTSLLVMHRMTSPQWLKHLKSAITALEPVEEKHLASLVAGEALVWAQRSSSLRFTQRPQKIVIRPRFSRHGGGTKTAVSGATVR